MESLAFPLTSADRLTLRHFRKSLPKAARASFDQSFDLVMAAERPFAMDPVTHGHQVIGACALCAYRAWVRQGLAADEAKAKVAGPLTTLGQRTIRLMMWLSFLFSRDVFEALRRYTRERGDTAYGPSFDIRYVELEDGFVSEVHTCGYRAFLMRHDALPLLDLFCEWDRTWIEALPRGIRFHRPPTQAQGGATCRFEFRRR